ncbi:MAG: glycosyltransferase family 2 protein, partial [Bacteroidia bacterium]
MALISAVIITRNEAANISRCLRSLEGIADEIVVADSGSTDETEQICRSQGVHFFGVEWQGYSKTKNMANNLAKGDFILSLDADEALSEPLRKAILRQKPYLSGAYSFNRLTWFAHHPVRFCGWYPDRKIRLFPKNQAFWEGDFVHETLTPHPSLTITHLTGDILHYSFSSTEDFISRMDYYARLAAQKLHSEGKNATWYRRFVSPVFKFLVIYFIRLGILDGKTGWQIAWYSAKAHFHRY